MTAFYISAAHKSSGKTMLSIGLGAAFKLQGLRVQPFKKGPDYIDPLWLGRSCGRSCYNLDFNTQQRLEILDLFRRKSAGADLVLVEGNKGLFDGMDLQGSDCNAAMASLLGLPIVLVLDAHGVTRGVAPLLLGYQRFAPDLRFAGVILNKVGGVRHESKLRRVIEHYTDIPVLGAVQQTQDMFISERHLGLVPSNEAAEVDATIQRMAAVVSAGVDLDGLLRHARWPGLEGLVASAEVLPPADLRLGVARDAAFGFYYPDDLEALRQAGAELVFFSPLRDPFLPPVDALFLGGGFPETQMEELAANGGMLRSVRDFIEVGGPAYAECGGLMYLCRSLHWQQKVCRMAGVIEADAVMYERPQGRGYVRLQVLPDHPWPGVEPGLELPVHEFHYSRLEHLGSGYGFAYALTRGEGIDGQRDGLIYRNLLAGYAHQRQVANNPWARQFVQFARQCVFALRS
jgi:cobyrinic acid a,c-diamide synthase